MAKLALTAKRIIKLLKQPGRYRDDEVRGLLLVVAASRSKDKSSTTASWILRYEFAKRERWLGLGSQREVSLKEARDLARDARALIRKGVDPVAAKQTAKAEAAATLASTISFKNAALAYASQHEVRWGNRKHRAQFLSTLETYAYPVIGTKNVADIDTADVLRILEQPVAASRGYPAGSFWSARRPGDRLTDPR